MMVMKERTGQRRGERPCFIPGGLSLLEVRRGKSVSKFMRLISPSDTEADVEWPEGRRQAEKGDATPPEIADRRPAVRAGQERPGDHLRGPNGGVVP